MLFLAVVPLGAGDVFLLALLMAAAAAAAAAAAFASAACCADMALVSLLDLIILEISG